MNVHTCRRLHEVVWNIVQHELQAATSGFDADVCFPLLALVGTLNSVGVFGVNTENHPSIQIRRQQSKFEFLRCGHAQSAELNCDELASEISTLLHEYGHFLRWRDNRRQFDRELLAVIKLHKNDSLTPLETMHIHLEEVFASVRGAWSLLLRREVQRALQEVGLRFLVMVCKANLRCLWSYRHAWKQTVWHYV